MSVSELPDHVRSNRAYWDGMAERWVGPGERAWAMEEPAWGVFQVPQSRAPFLPEDVRGLDAIELGCGTGYVSAWLARRGARPVGIDNSQGQLATARRLQAEHGVEFPLLHGNAEQVPYPDASFDLAVSEYGAAIWCDPYAWIPEAARLLRPGGRLVFLCNSVLSALCAPEDDGPSTARLLRPQRGLHRQAWPEGGVEFHLGHGEMIGLLRANGFEVEDLIEIYAPEDAQESAWFGYAALDWARQWPVEEVWKARLAG